MVRLIQKSGYVKRDRAGGYMRYIATREGVERHSAPMPATEKQSALMEKLLRDFPDSKELFEYEDFLSSPTSENASAFISTAIDMNAHTLSETDGYMRYIALRPRAQRRGEHGLFGAQDDVDLNAAQRELNEHQGNVWTLIYSLRREDASRLGFDNADAWRNLISANTGVLSKAMKIPENEFRWYAAFHDEGHHPHIHMMVWADDGSSGFLAKSGIAAMRSKLTNVIFKDEMTQIYVQKDIAYKELTAAARASMSKLRSSAASGICECPRIEELLLKLAIQLESTSGKKQYGYLPQELKSVVDEIVTELESLPEVAKAYSDWNALRDAVESYYKDMPRTPLPLAEQKEFRAVKNIVVREAARLSEVLLRTEGEKHYTPEIERAKRTLQNEAAPPEEKRAALFYLYTCAENGNTYAKHFYDHTGRYRMTELAYSVTQIFMGLTDVFGSNSLAPPHPAGVRMYATRRKKLIKQKLALGQRLDDHDDYNMDMKM